MEAEIKKRCFFCGDEITTEWVDTIKCRVNGESKLVFICKRCLHELKDDDYDTKEREPIEEEEDEDDER